VCDLLTTEIILIMVETDGDKIRDRNRDRDQRGDDAIKRENNSLIDFVLKNLDLSAQKS